MAPTPTELVFFVNGRKVVEKNPDPESTLLQYIRRTLLIAGTKEGCGHGGCGSCTVMLSRHDHRQQCTSHYTVNACLFPLCAVHGLAVTTVEGVGNPRTGLHEVQRRLIESHGVQCGFCTPGFVMAVFTLLRNNPLPTRDELERALEGNLCRCTGYRPIVEAFKPLTKEGCPMGEACCQNQPPSTTEKVDKSTTEQETSQVAIFPAELKLSDQYMENTISFEGKRWKWIRPTSLADLLTFKQQHPGAPLIMGNTMAALQIKMGRFDDSPVLIYGGSVEELKNVEVTETGIELGAALTITELSNTLQSLSTKIEGSKQRFCPALMDMASRYGADQIRNVATLAGSIMSGRSNSDVTTLLAALDAELALRSADGDRTVAIGNKPSGSEVIVSIHIPFSRQDDHLMFFKQGDRTSFSLATVNAGIRVRFGAGQTVAALTLCFGGVASSVLTAVKAGSTAVGRTWNDELLKAVTATLEEELVADSAEESAVYKATLATSFFYRFYLNVSNSMATVDLSTQMKDAIEPQSFSPSEGVQFYESCVDENQKDTDDVGKPVLNVAAPSLVSGESVFLDDISRSDGELFLEPVTSTRAHARVVNVDVSKALAVDGVYGYVDHTDVPGQKHFGALGDKDEPIFASDVVNCHGEMIGGILAESREIARRAAKMVEVEYEDLDVILTLEESIEKKWINYSKTQHLLDGDVEKGFEQSDCVVEGEFYVGAQEHFYMETHCSLVRLVLEGDELEVTTSSQCLTNVQESIGRALNMPSSKVVCRVKRLGGGFGGKMSRDVLPALPAAVAANKFRRPVRCVFSRELDMAISGKRHPFLAKYKVGVTKAGKILALQMQLYVNAGCYLDHAAGVAQKCLLVFETGLKVPNVDIHGYVCHTNTATNTAMRGYGPPEACIIMEDVVFNAACKLGMPADKIKELNLYKAGDVTAYQKSLSDCTLDLLWQECQRKSDYENRIKEIEDFNRNHRWKKRGLAMTADNYGIGFRVGHLYQASALVNIYKDGSVLLSYGGIEMGQGLNTKMIQIASRVLGVPMGHIFISESSTSKSCNATITGASIGTDLNGPAVMDACRILSDRLKPIRDTNSGGKWADMISQAYFQRVKLSAIGFSRQEKVATFNMKDKSGQAFDYFTYGVACSEVEIDCLTGKNQVIRTDIVVDMGRSLNPGIDIGQIEGAFVQGMGMVTTEDIPVVSDGRMANCSPLSYKMPMVRCIPRQFNVSLMKNTDVVTPVYSSKGIGEPALLLSRSVITAIKEAVRAARAEFGLHGYFRLDSPATFAKIRSACGDQLKSATA